MKFAIRNRWTGNVQFECELDAEIAGKSLSIQLGFAVRKAAATGADLRDAVLRGADLRGAVLRGAVLRDADLRDADLRDAVLRGADLSGAPVIPNIHQQVYAAASALDALDMGDWHRCDTTHCRAGWVTTLAGEEGLALENRIGTAAAAALIYLASDPEIERIPDFYCDNVTALADMKRLADAEAAKSGAIA